MASQEASPLDWRAVVAHPALEGISGEPLIPDQVCAFLLTCVIAGAVLLRDHERRRVTLVGAMVGALILAKTNVGGATRLGVLLVLAVSMPALSRRPLIARALAVPGAYSCRPC